MNADEPVKIRAGFSCSHAIGSDYEETFDGPARSEWDEMDDEERSAYLNECAQTALFNQVEAFAEVIDE